QIARLNGFALLLGWAFVALSAALAWPVAGFFGEPAVRWIILASSITFLMTALQVVPRALLTRDLDFRRLAWADGAEALVAAGAGRVLGKAALGAYTLGWTISSIPVDRVSALVGSVTPAVFSAVQHDRPALQRYLRNLTEALAFITFPAAVGIALIADEFVLL